MTTLDNLQTKVFPMQREDTIDGVLTRFAAVGNGRTVVISQIEGQRLCVDVYAIEVNSLDDLQGRRADKAIEVERPPKLSDEDLRLLAAHCLAY